MAFPRPAVLVGICALLTVGCVFGKDDDASDSSTPADPVPGSGAPPADPNAAPPPLSFELPNAPTDPGAPTDPVIMDTDPGPSLGQVIWAVDDQNHLLRFGTQSLDQVAVKTITGLVDGDLVLDIDFRPASGVLFALGRSNRIYTLDQTTGVATAIGDEFMTPAAGQGHGIDFNPSVDKLRVHTDVDVNLRVDPLTGVATMDAPLAFAADDVNFGQSPNLVGNAYTNNATTVLYAIDSTRDILVMLPTPNDGSIKTIGPLGVDTDGFVGFDIRGADASKMVFATMRVGGKNGLYSVDLTTGAATALGEIAFPRTIPGLAIAP